MEIIGRTTADAVVNETKAEKKVVNFSIAINDTYKAKNSKEVQRTVTYVQCSYWLNAGVAALLTKGTLVECAGRIGVATWTDKDGVTKAGLTFNAAKIKLHSGGSSKANVTDTPVSTSPQLATANEDLPF